ncbi:unnamed protein product [Urochloa humidicola]
MVGSTFRRYGRTDYLSVKSRSRQKLLTHSSSNHYQLPNPPPLSSPTTEHPGGQEIGGARKLSTTQGIGIARVLSLLDSAASLLELSRCGGGRDLEFRHRSMRWIMQMYDVFK